MSIVTRHVLWELTRVFLLTLTALTALMLLVGVAQEAVRQGLGIAPILRLMPYLTPNALCFAIPGSILFTVTSVFGRMAADNEVTALKSLGISPLTIVWPALISAFFLSLVVVWLNDIAFSWGYAGVQRVVVQSIEEIAYSMLQTQRTYSSKRFSMNVKRVEGRTLVRPTITFQPSGDAPAMTLIAREAELKFNPEESTLSIFLTNGTIEVEGVATMEFDDTIERVVPLGEDSSNEGGLVSPVHLPMSLVPEAIDKENLRLGLLRQVLATDSAYDLVLGDFDELTGPKRAKQRDDVSKSQQRMNRLATEPWRRWAIGFSCLAFCAVGIPLSLLMRNSDTATTFFRCFLPILLVYYPFLAYGIDRAKAGAMPPYVVWVGNLFCFLVAAWLLWRVRRY